MDPTEDRTAFYPEPVMRPRQQVETQLRTAILGGVFARGEKLPSEAMLAKRFKVSRATVREALRGMVEAGFISTTPGATGGSFVTYLDHHRLGEIVSERLSTTLELGSISYEELNAFRTMLEVPSAQLAALNRSDEHILGLRAVIDKEKRAAVDSPEVQSYNAEFHRIVAEASGNRLLSSFIVALHSVARPLRFIETNEEVGRNAVRHHIAIVAAITSQDPSDAGKCMIKHLDYLRDHAM
jgi:DNA-binding FadR family transcriptional regulator